MDLGSLNSDAIENIINSMSQKDIEDLTAMASQLFSGGNSNSTSNSSFNPNSNPKPEHNDPADGIDFDTITKIASVLGRLSSQPKDPGCELLTALKPMLSPERRHKADEAIKMMRLISLLPLLKDLQ